MKQLIISIVLSICLVGCGEKPKFSINESDTSETYDNNPIFTKIKISLIVDGKEEKDDKFGYQFTSAPMSVYGLETGDLNVIGGTIISSTAGLKVTTTLTIKGKESFDKLEKRLNGKKELTCNEINIGNSISLNCNVEQRQGRVMMSAHYNSFSDISSLMYLKY